MVKIAILTVSDQASQGKREDVSGELLLKQSRVLGEVVIKEIIPDNLEQIKEKLISYADQLKVDFVFTTGGTGFSPRDLTPEATSQVIEREVPGIPELIRSEGGKKTKRAYLSRAKAGIRGKTLIINFPGSVKGVEESWQAVSSLLPHSLEMLAGKGHKKGVEKRARKSGKRTGQR